MFLIPKKLPGFEEADGQSNALASMYGAAALAVGFFAFLVWRSYPNADLQYSFLLTFLIFHAGVMTASYKGYRSGLKDMMPVAILHGIFAIGTLYFFIQQ